VTLVHAALLGVVQGLTEFLPVSSSAHLLLARALFGWDAEAMGLAFDVACHVGTLAAVVLYFRRDLLEMLRALPRLFSDEPAPRTARLIVVGTLPVVVVGLTMASIIERDLRTPLVSIVMLAAGAVGLLWVERVGPRTRGELDLGYWGALGLGLGQSAALVPGVSRSGITITVAMLLGMRRASAARFSFLLGVPAILAAAGKEGLELLSAPPAPGRATLFAVGMISSAAVGYVTIAYLLRYLVKHRLDPFAYYRLALAAVLSVWLVSR
jgi:undecaprenyl-diphosphatase